MVKRLTCDCENVSDKRYEPFTERRDTEEKIQKIIYHLREK